MTPPHHKEHLPLVGISACLVGQRVRYDGHDKFNALVAEHIAPYCRLLPLCPEAIAGMGIPRPPIHLVQTSAGIRAVGRNAPHTDVTDRIHTIADIVANVYPQLRGFILQSRSPSCGFNTTPVYDSEQSAILQPQGSGLFAARIRQRFPDLPLLNDSDLTPTTIAEFLYQIASPQPG